MHESTNAIALDDYRRAREELSAMAPSLVEGAGREVDVAAWYGPIGYEVLTGLGRRHPRWMERKCMEPGGRQPPTHRSRKTWGGFCRCFGPDFRPAGSPPRPPGTT